MSRRGPARTLVLGVRSQQFLDPDIVKRGCATKHQSDESNAHSRTVSPDFIRMRFFIIILVFAVQITLLCVYVLSIKVILITFLVLRVGKTIRKIYWGNIQISQ